MTRSAQHFGPGSEFHAFLYATLGQDSNGLQLSVISALARMGLDPWEEAAVLARLPGDAMANKMVALFNTVPDQTLGDQDRGAMAKRLGALLPRSEAAEATVPEASFISNDAARSRFGVLLFSLFIFVLMTARFVMARMEPPTQGRPSPVTTGIAKPAPTIVAPSDQ